MEHLYNYIAGKSLFIYDMNMSNFTEDFACKSLFIYNMNMSNFTEDSTATNFI